MGGERERGGERETGWGEEREERERERRERGRGRETGWGEERAHHSLDVINHHGVGAVKSPGLLN